MVPAAIKVHRQPGGAHTKRRRRLQRAACGQGSVLSQPAARGPRGEGRPARHAGRRRAHALRRLAWDDKAELSNLHPAAAQATRVPRQCQCRHGRPQPRQQAHPAALGRKLFAVRNAKAGQQRQRQRIGSAAAVAAAARGHKSACAFPRLGPFTKNAVFGDILNFALETPHPAKGAQSSSSPYAARCGPDSWQCSASAARYSREWKASSSARLAGVASSTAAPCGRSVRQERSACGPPPTAEPGWRVLP